MTMTDQARLAAFDEHRGFLFSVAYRMLGSVADAEDVLQETFIRWAQVERDDVRTPKAFLISIITRLCINHLQSARVRREEYVGQWLPEPLVFDEPAGDDSLSIAFLVLLERLNPVERAVFLLREVFDYEYSEIAAIVGSTETNCRQILKRAKEHVRAARPRFEPKEAEHDALLRQFQQTAASGDVASLAALLADDVVLHSDGGGKGPAVPNQIRGAKNVSTLIATRVTKSTRRLVQTMTQINGEQAVVTYENGRPFSVVSIHVSDGKIDAIYVITNPDKLTHLPGVPDAPV